MGLELVRSGSGRNSIVNATLAVDRKSSKKDLQRQSSGHKFIRQNRSANFFNSDSRIKNRDSFISSEERSNDLVDEDDNADAEVD